MRIDKFGQQIYSEQDLINAYLANPSGTIKKVLTSENITFPSTLDIENIPDLIKYVEPPQSLTIRQFDEEMLAHWYIPEEYVDFDIAKYVLDQCKTETELQRAGQELLIYQERNLFMLLRYLKYLVDTMRKHNIVWGVGRGSSVSSFVLYLIGIHRIDSLYYDLSIDEFLG